MKITKDLVYQLEDELAEEIELKGITKRACFLFATVRRYRNTLGLPMEEINISGNVVAQLM